MTQERCTNSARFTLCALLAGYTRHTALGLVYHLAQLDAPAGLYEDAARILQRAAEDRAAGLDPGAHVKQLENGTLTEI